MVSRRAPDSNVGQPRRQLRFDRHLRLLKAKSRELVPGVASIAKLAGGSDGAVVYTVRERLVATGSRRCGQAPRGDHGRQLTFSSQLAFRKEHFASLERVSFPSFDGLMLHGFLLTPRNVGASEQIPGVVCLHPNGYGQFSDYWSPFFHYLATSGYAVLLLDQRGVPATVVRFDSLRSAHGGQR